MTSHNFSDDSLTAADNVSVKSNQANEVLAADNDNPAAIDSNSAVSDEDDMVTEANDCVHSKKVGLYNNYAATFCYYNIIIWIILLLYAHQHCYRYKLNL